MNSELPCCRFQRGWDRAEPSRGAIERVGPSPGSVARGAIENGANANRAADQLRPPPRRPNRPAHRGGAPPPPPL